jgi:hypothetical protein
MPEIHLPHLEEDEDEPASQPVSTRASLLETARPHRRHSWLKLVLEVVLITAGVFLGLAGESWRESREHRELAEQSLRRFRDEFKANRTAVERVHQRHQDQEKGLSDYFAAHGPALMASMLDPRKPIPGPVPDIVTDSAVFDYSAWDVALATESLAYIDPELVAMISDAHRMQQMIEDDHTAITQVTYSFQNQVHWLRGLGGSFGDTALHERLLLERYDKLQPRLDEAIGADE